MRYETFVARVRRSISMQLPGGQHGGSLLEALVAVMVVSVLLLGVMAGMSTSATVSQSTGQAARARAGLAEVTDRVATIAYPGCGDAAALTTAVRAGITVPAGFEVSVTAVANLVPPGPACTTQTSVRMVTLRVVQVRTSTSLTGQVVLRDPAARPS